MNLKDKEVLVMGLGISGAWTVKILHKLGAIITITDTKHRNELRESLNQIKDILVKESLGTNDIDLDNIDLIIKSPGIPPKSQIIKKALKQNIPVINDIELGFSLLKSKNIIAITGTNGKTTTTSLVGEIFKEQVPGTFIVGNIGVSILENIMNIDSNDAIIVEASSFQLEHIKSFKPKISLILNLSPDHIDWHGSYENYINAKKKVFKNQSKDDYIVLNYDDKIVRSFEKEIDANIIWFSVNNPLEQGVYICNDQIIIRSGNEKIQLISIKDLKIIGKHNLENVLASVAIAYASNLNMDKVKDSLMNFSGVEHRLEFVTTKANRDFYNDSKGTNPEASIKAIEALKEPIILIAGGYDKEGEFDEFIKSFDEKVKALILLGETKDKIESTALKYGFKDNYLVESIKDAVDLSYGLSEEGDNILLSPACASWDMFNSFEERGNAFKKAVYDLREE